jgi:hypothetical protein
MAAFVKMMVAHDAQLDAAEMAAEPESDSEPESESLAQFYQGAEVCF